MLATLCTRSVLAESFQSGNGIYIGNEVRHIGIFTHHRRERQFQTTTKIHHYTAVANSHNQGAVSRRNQSQKRAGKIANC